MKKLKVARRAKVDEGLILKNGPKHLQNKHNNEILGSTLFNARKYFL